MENTTKTLRVSSKIKGELILSQLSINRGFRAGETVTIGQDEYENFYVQQAIRAGLLEDIEEENNSTEEKNINMSYSNEDDSSEKVAQTLKSDVNTYDPNDPNDLSEESHDQETYNPMDLEDEDSIEADQGPKTNPVVWDISENEGMSKQEGRKKTMENLNGKEIPPVDEKPEQKLRVPKGFELGKTKRELIKQAQKLRIKGYYKMNKKNLKEAVLEAAANRNDPLIDNDNPDLDFVYQNDGQDLDFIDD
jgi:hypothetical protein